MLCIVYSCVHLLLSFIKKKFLVKKWGGNAEQWFSPFWENSDCLLLMAFRLTIISGLPQDNKNSFLFSISVSFIFPLFWHMTQFFYAPGSTLGLSLNCLQSALDDFHLSLNNHRLASSNSTSDSGYPTIKALLMLRLSFKI